MVEADKFNQIWNAWGVSLLAERDRWRASS